MCDEIYFEDFENLHDIIEEEDEFEYDSVSMVSSSIVPSEIALAGLNRRQLLLEKIDENFQGNSIQPSDNNRINLQIQLITNTNGSYYLKDYHLSA